MNRHANDAQADPGRLGAGRRALFLGAGAAVAQTTGDESSSGTSGGATTTVQDGQNQNRSATDCPERSGTDNGADESTA